MEDQKRERSNKMNLDQMVADALKRIRHFVNLSAAQHKFMLRGKRKL